MSPTPQTQAESSKQATSQRAQLQTPTSRALAELLKVTGGPIPTGAFVSLICMEKRKALTTEAPENTPKTCCFDIGSPPHGNATWAAHSICPRCRNLNEILQAQRRNSTSTLVKAIAANAVHLTDCVSEPQPSKLQSGFERTSGLPWELILLVLEFAIAGFDRDRRSIVEKPGWLRKWWPSVAPLLHVSSTVRYLTSKAFKTVVLQEGVPDNVQEEMEDIRITRDLSAFIWSLADFHVLDSSVKRHERIKAPTFKPCSDFLTTAIRSPAQRVTCRVTISWLANFTRRGIVPVDPEIREATCSASVDGTGGSPFGASDGDNFCTITDTCLALQEAWNAFKQAPRPCNPFQRALDATREASERITTIDTTISINHVGSSGIATTMCQRTWRFVTRGPEYHT